ncbi:MAG TPA: bifunctional indole-3-glycerol phosphate synthase/phosphoribosylanthranilate isomerase, partial [Spirochaetales bacterium]|nr:bifunctional indole-3-glycerol phosphate synthase/phosphoribosylanthranilate isomerase [Spirochaetales bacterium]
MNIRDTIVASRRLRLQKIGHTQGLDIPIRRQLPLVPFKNPPLLICEIKRRSPSRGAIDPELDPVEVAKTYSRSGVGSFSVLTEEDYFSGSLKDLMKVKAALPHASVLRKDFLLD